MKSGRDLAATDCEVLCLCNTTGGTENGRHSSGAAVKEFEEMREGKRRREIEKESEVPKHKETMWNGLSDDYKQKSENKKIFFSLKQIKNFCRQQRKNRGKKFISFLFFFFFFAPPLCVFNFYLILFYLLNLIQFAFLHIFLVF